ncbi:hypothetical protein ACWD7B_17955 [Streptomyces rubiginosohelvolus]
MNESAAGSGQSGLGPRGSLVMSLTLTLLLGMLSLLVMFPAAEHLRSLKGGERADATLHTSGSCMIGQCRVEFEADGRTVVADLPTGSGGKQSVGATVTVRYQADDPQVVAREEDVGGGGAALFAWMSAGAALLFLVLSAVAAVFLARQRRKAAAGTGAAG